MTCRHEGEERAPGPEHDLGTRLGPGAEGDEHERVVVWKYPFEVVGYFERELPVGARIISVAVQLGQPCFWALVNPRANGQVRRFYVLGTGHEIQDDDAEYLFHRGTFMLDGGRFVGHLFELGA